MGVNHDACELSGNWNEVLLEAADNEGVLNYEDFSRLALFHPKLGYYAQQSKKRVGKTERADFYTASSHAEVFPALIIESARSLLEKQALKPDEFTFVELGAEPEQDAWSSVDFPFKDYRVLRLGDNFVIPEKAIVYSNELFDAQPFHRWIAVDGAWKPVHLHIQNNKISEVISEKILSASEQSCLEMLPKPPAFSYHFDLSTQARELCHRICQSSWCGLFLAFDYGMMWKQLAEETPQGTARAYFRHQQETLLFKQPGEQDITTHVCWDHLSDVLHASGFSQVKVRTQSRFLMEEATSVIESIVTSSQTLTDKRKSQLLELISPGFFGQKFQVLSALRR